MAEVKIEITAQDNVSPVLKNIQASNSSALTAMSAETKNYTEGSKSLISSLKEHWIAASAAVYGAWKIVHEAIDLAKMGAMAKQAEESFRAVTRSYGVDADELLAKMKQASAGLIDESGLMQRAVKGLMQGLDAEQLIKFADYSRYAARIAGTSVAEGFDIATNSIANQAPKMAKQIGLMFDLNKAFDEEAQKLGTVTAGLSEMTQSHALGAQAVEQMNQKMEKMGPLTKNAAEKFQEAQVQIEELRETIGGGLLIVFDAVGAVLYSIASAALYAASGLMRIVQAADYLTLQFDKAKESGEMSKAMFAAAGDVAGKAGVMFSGVGSALDGTSKAQGIMTEAQKKSDQTAKQQADSMNLLKDKIRETNLTFEEFSKKMEGLNPDLNETSQAVTGITSEVQKLKEEIKKNVGQNVLDQLAPKFDEKAAEGIFNVYKKQLKEFTDMIRDTAIARQKAADEASLAAGNLFAMPKGALAEVDKWFAEMADKYKNNSAMLSALANEAEAKRFEVMNDWAIKRLEKEKETTDKQISLLDTWKSALETDYNTAIAKAKEYEAIETDLTKELAKRQQILATGFGDSTQSLFSQINDAKDVVHNLISAADYSRDTEKLKTALDAIDQFRAKYKDTRDELSQPVISGNTYYNEYKALTEQIKSLGEAASESKNKFNNFAESRKADYTAVATMFDELKAKTADLDTLLAKQRSITIDTSGALTSINELQNKISGLTAATAAAGGAGNLSGALGSVSSQLQSVIQANQLNPGTQNQAIFALTSLATSLGNASQGIGQSSNSLTVSMNNAATNIDMASKNIKNAAGVVPSQSEIIAGWNNLILDNLKYVKATPQEEAQGYIGSWVADPDLLAKRDASYNRMSDTGYAGGTSFVSETAYRKVHYGEIILDPQEADQYRRGSGGKGTVINNNISHNFTVSGANDPVGISRMAGNYMRQEINQLKSRIRTMAQN